jgi:diaminohydroxyphosphoribosylaminopyrimidine deaminase/5-amino-6-(5-phosphoribosylamino)uracil reductase
MEQALALASLAEGRTSPNPRVGCVLVRGDDVVGAGFHPAAGHPHAEAVAVGIAGDRARGATAYVNLEPCAHTGRTPPCADLLIRAGVRRVVASVVDPNPLVDGHGFERLRAAGVAVQVGLLAGPARRLNAPFFTWFERGRPRVTIKAGMSLDGRLAAAGGRSRWITGEPARRFAHRLRMRHDAILVGVGTVAADDPELTVRLPGVHAPRIRAVLDPEGRIPAAAAILRHGPAGTPRTRVYTAASPREETSAAEWVVVPAGPTGLDLAAVLADLGERGVQSVLVEGGGRTVAGFLDAGLADEAALFVAPSLLGSEGGIPLVAGPAASDPKRAWRLAGVRSVALGADTLHWGDLVRAE